MTHNPEQALWQEVLYRQIDDALNGPSSLATKEERLAVCVEARRYLTTPSAELAHLCELAGIDPAALVDRMRSKIVAAPAPEELVSTSKAHRAKISAAAKAQTTKMTRVATREYTINGETLTLAQWAERTGTSMTIISQRINAGWSAERAILQPLGTRRNPAKDQKPKLRKPCKPRKPKADNRPIRITHEGRTHTLKEWSEITGIVKETLAKRHRLGWPVERILDQRDHRMTQKVVALRDSHMAAGGGSDFEGVQGTGGGTTEQDRPEIDFSEKAA